MECHFEQPDPLIDPIIFNQKVSIIDLILRKLQL